MKKRRSSRKGLIILVLAIIIVLWSSFSWYNQSIQSPVDATDNTQVSFLVKEGERFEDIAENLDKKELIISPLALKIYTRLNNIDRNLVAGRFLLSKSMNMIEVMNTLSDTTQSEVILTIPEGSTVSDIDKKLVSLELIDEGAFEQSVKNFQEYDEYPFMDKMSMQNLPFPLEGYLFPDTYFLPTQNFHPENLIQLMIKNFEQKIENVSWDKEERTVHELVTMASIVEKEVRTPQDIPIVAGILWKRLELGWPLGADATLLYLKNDRTIDFNDLQEESPYNTRKNTGLPPGPINNPGLSMLQGSAQPEDSPYFFYITTPDTNEVIYAVTNDEHNANRAKYLN